MNIKVLIANYKSDLIKSLTIGVIFSYLKEEKKKTFCKNLGLKSRGSAQIQKEG